MKRFAVLLMLSVLFCAFAFGETYPSRNLSGVIAWGAGGGTDSLMRPLASLAEESLGVSIIVKNVPGGTGSIATQTVYDAKADGYTLLMNAENPALYPVLEISELSYDDFDCIFLVGDETVGIVVKNDAPWASFQDLIGDALGNPGKMKISTTGIGGLPWEMGAMVTHVTGASFNQIPYDSDASALTAVLNGECDFTVCKVQSGIESWKAGELRYLTMMSTVPVPEMDSIPLITDDFPDFTAFLPWGPFYGVFVRKGTDPDIRKILSDTFEKAYASDSYQILLKNRHINALGITGDDAEAYIQAWQKKTLEALRNSGAI